MNATVQPPVYAMEPRLRVRAFRRAVWLFCLSVGLAADVPAKLIRQTVAYPPEAVAGWPSLDFDGDGIAELAFENYAIGHEMGGVMFLDVRGSPNTEVLLEGSRVLPLSAGTTVSLTPVRGQWQATGLQNSVWTWSFSSVPDTNIIVIGGPPVGDPPQQPPPGQGVGMPGYGDFMGVRFLSGSDWHYGWVRFGLLDSASLPLPQPGWPSVLEYTYETMPGTPVLVPEPSALALLATGGLLLIRFTRRSGGASRNLFGQLGPR